ncbi:MAG: hypothetical protein GON13_02995 [Nanoarchaeota archaeon]|nr:hypothetical protein [Nanoarchaeota archaeon]
MMVETKEITLDYKEQMLMSLRQNHKVNRMGQPEGLTFEDTEKRLKVINLIEPLTSEILLEDSDYNILKEAVLDVKYSIVAEELVQFCQDIKNAEDITVTEKN